MLSTPSEAKAKEWSQYYTSGPHLAGKNYSQAAWTRDRFEEFGIPAEIVTYEIYTNYPVSHRLALLQGKDASNSSITRRDNAFHDEKAFKVVFEASLEEDVLQADPTTGLKNRIPTFHGYSAKYIFFIMTIISSLLIVVIAEISRRNISSQTTEHIATMKTSPATE